MKDHNLTDIADLFILDCKSRRLTQSTLSFYGLKIKRFIAYLADNGITTIGTITNNHIRQYLLSLQAAGMTAHSQHDYARAAKTFLAFCVREELIEQTPWRNVGMPTLVDSLPIVLTDDQLRQALEQVTSERNRLIIRFILDSGVRASELLSLDVGDVDLASGVVVVKLGKGQKERLTAIGNTTRKALRRYLMDRGVIHRKGEPLLVPERGGNKHRLGRDSLMSAFRIMRRECGVEDLTAHTLRRTMATRAIEAGMNEFVLARLLGHGDTAILRKYVRVSRKMVQGASDKFSLVDNL